MTVLALALAGGLGAVARFVVDGAVKRRWTSDFPLATLLINVTGSLVLGVLAGLVLFRDTPSAVQLVAGTGFCGGYTTFSTASFETVRLVQGGRALSALAYAVGSVVLSVAAAGVGLVLTR